MAIIHGLVALMNQVLTIESHSGVDNYGVPSYGAPADIVARLTQKQRLVEQIDGTRAVSRSQAWCPPDVAITENDRVTLPDGTQPRLLSVSLLSDEEGNPSHYELMFA
jgi:hypothetical protein